MSRLHFANFEGLTESKRNVNIGRKQTSNRNDFLQRRQAEREKRAKLRKDESSAIIIQSAWRSYTCRQRLLLEIHEELGKQIKSKSMESCLGNLIRMFLISSRGHISDDTVISGLVGTLSRTKLSLVRLSEVSICNGFLVVEILKYVQNLCCEAAPRIGPGLRLIERYILEQPTCIVDAMQFGFFRLIVQIQLALLPSDTTDLSRCPPRVAAISDIVIKALKTALLGNRSSLAIRCFLRDYIGSSDSSFLVCRIAEDISKESQLSDAILSTIESLISEVPKIVSYSQDCNQFGDFSRRTIRNFNNPLLVPIFPDGDMLQFLLVISKDTAGIANLKSICWCSEFYSSQLHKQPSDVFDMDDDEDWLDEDEIEFEDEDRFILTLNRNEQKLRSSLSNFFASVDFDEIDPSFVGEIVKLLSSINDSSIYLKVSMKTGFLRNLWMKIMEMESQSGGTIAHRLQIFTTVSSEEFFDFSAMLHYFCSAIRLQLIALSDDDLKLDRFLVHSAELTQFTSILCKLGVGIIKFLFGGQRDNRVSTSTGFNVLGPMSKVLRNLLSRAERIPDLMDRQFSNHVIFIVEDFSILRKQPMIDETTKYQNVAKNFYGARNYDKQLMTILSFFPFVIPFQKRVEIFYNLLANDNIERNSRRNNIRQYDRHTFKIRREQVFADAFSEMNEANFPDWRQPFNVQVMSDGRQEPGFGQGINRWFMESLLQHAFDPNVGLILQNENKELYPNPFVAHIYPDSFEYYKFLGKILGYMVYTQSLNYLPLCSFFLSKILRGSIELDLSELQGLDKELYKNLMYLKSHPDEIDSMGLDFTATVSSLGNVQTVELKPNGANIPVDRINYTEFIIKVADFHLNRAVAPQCNAFRAGFYSIIDQAWVKLFDQREFDILIQGVKQDIDIDDLRENTVYYNHGFDAERSFSAEHPTIVALWEVLGSFCTEDRVKFLRFATSASRAPLRGFKELIPKFTLINTNEESERLPSASTCVNLLKMPPYPNRTILEEKLRIAIETVTFEFS